MDKKYVVYQHVTPDGFFYFGVTSNIKRRWRNNGAEYKRTALQPYIEKFGWDNIKHIVLFKDQSKENALWIENFLIETAREDGVCINKQRSGLVSKEEGYRQQIYKQYYEQNREKELEKSKQYYEQNKDKIREYQREYNREYREQNKDKIREYKREYNREYYREYREQNKDKIQEYQREYQQEYYKKNKDKLNQYQREYREQNKDKLREYNRQRYQKNRDEINERRRQRYQRKKLEKQLKEVETTLF